MIQTPTIDRSSLQYVACHICTTPTVVAVALGVLVRCDVWSLTPGAEERAWGTGLNTYLTRSHGLRQWLLWRTPSPTAAQQLAREIHARDHPDQVVLAEHQCQGPPDGHEPRHESEFAAGRALDEVRPINEVHEAGWHP